MYSVAHFTENVFHCDNWKDLEIPRIFFPSECPCNCILLIGMFISHFSSCGEVFQQYHVKVLNQVFS